MHFVFSVGTEEICAAGQGVQKLEREGEQHIFQLITAGPTEILVEEGLVLSVYCFPATQSCPYDANPQRICLKD